jgi:hypothetical protein
MTPPSVVLLLVGDEDTYLGEEGKCVPLGIPRRASNLEVELMPSLAFGEAKSWRQFRAVT